MKKTPIYLAVKERLSHGSILWRAVLYSIVLSTFIISVLSGISYIFMISLIKKDVVEADVYEVLDSAATFGQTFIVIGVVFLVLAIVLSFSFGRKLTRPFMEMKKKIERLGPGHWRYRHTVKTGDEAEQLDIVVADLTSRLRKMYEDLEGEVADRTAELEKQFAKDRTILKALNIGLIVVDNKGTVLQANPAAASLLKCKTCTGKPITKTMKIHKSKSLLDDKEHYVMQCLKTRKEIHTIPSEHVSIINKDNSAFAAKISAVPLLQKGKLQGAIALFQDVTMECQIDYMKTDFITLASHHLRTPIASMQWYLELLSTEQQECLTTEQKSFITEMRLASKKMAGVIDELMDVIRLNEEGINPSVQKVNFNTLAKEAIQDARLLLTEKDIQLSIKLPKGNIFAQTDPLFMSIIFQNLLSNAVKYSHEKGPIEVTLKKNKTHINLSVKDEGIGIPYAEQERIFDKMYRAENARKMEANGAGLGLHSSRVIARKLDADLTFKSTEGKGSTFTLTLPIKPKK